jgi:CO/xanthine dehydrogenase FAD-binding subunit
MFDGSWNMAQIKEYIRAKSIQEACSCLEQPGYRVIAGGTDLLLKARRNGLEEMTLIDISDIKDLTGIYADQDGIHIGAATRLADIVKESLLQQQPFSALVQGAVQVGSLQIRNLATLGGNICNAAPSADTAAPLLVLDAWAEIESRSGRYSLPLTEFFQGPGKTALKPGELLVSISIPRPAEPAKAVYLKHCPRKAMDLAVVGIAVLRRQDSHSHTRIAMGAVAPVPQRAYAAEALIDNAEHVDETLLEEAARLTAEASHPISDVRSSENYRKEIVAVLTKRALFQVFGT